MTAPAPRARRSVQMPITAGAPGSGTAWNPLWGRVLPVAAVVACNIAFSLEETFQWPGMLLAWVALVPWLATLDDTPSLRAALRLGVLMSVVFVVMTFNWFASSIQAYTGAPRPVALLCMALLAPMLEPQFITFALARYLARRYGGGKAFWRIAITGACVYAGTDWAWPKLFGDTLGYGLYPSVLMRQAADIAGVHGLTFIVVIVNECVLFATRALIRPRNSASARPDDATGPFPRRRRDALAPACCGFALIVALLGYGQLRYDQFHGTSPSGDSITAGLIQADISHYNQMAAELGTFEAVRRILDAHFTLSSEALARAPLDLLVWPETVYPTTFGSPKSADGAAFDREIGGFVTSKDVPLVFGAYDADGDDEYNAAMFLEPTRDRKVTFDAYRKASLFPLTERVPKVFESSLVRSWLPWLGTWKPGTGTKVMPVTLRGGRSVLVAPLICYDAVDPNLALAAVRRGAELIVTISNDVWFAYGPAPYGHLVYAAFRSIETRRPQLRATTTGMSAVIAPTGEFLTTAGVHERAALVGTVTPERHATTLLLAWGDWFGPTVLFASLVLLGVPLLNAVSRPQPARTGRRRAQARR